MSYWKGFALAYRDADDRKQELEDQQFRKDLINEERAYDRDFFFEQLKAKEQSAMRQQAFTAGITGGSGVAGGRSSSKSSKIGILGIAKAFPNLSADKIATLSNNPHLIGPAYDLMTKKKQEAIDARLPWDDSTAEETFDIIQEAPPMSPEELEAYVDGRAAHIGVDPDAPAYGFGKTWGELLTPSQADRVSFVANPTAEPMSTEQIKLVQETAGGTVTGYLNQQKTQLHQELRSLGTDTENETARDEVAAKIQKIDEDLKEIAEGRMDAVMSTEQGTATLIRMWEAGWQFDYGYPFPNYTPTFKSEEEVREATIIGFVKYGDVVDIDGVRTKVEW